MGLYPADQCGNCGHMYAEHHRNQDERCSRWVFPIADAERCGCAEFNDVRPKSKGTRAGRLLKKGDVIANVKGLDGGPIMWNRTMTLLENPTLNKSGIHVRVFQNGSEHRQRLSADYPYPIF